MVAKIGIILAFLLLVSIANASSVYIPIMQQVTSTYCSPTGAINALVPWYCSQVNQAVYNNWITWLPVAILVIVFSFSIGAAIFMVGIALRSQSIRNYGVGELYEAIATALIVCMFMLIAAVLFGLLPGLTVGNVDPFNASLSYLNQSINATGFTIDVLFQSQLIAQVYSSVTLEVSTFTWATDVQNVFAAIIQVLYVIPAEGFGRLLIDGLLLQNVEYYLILFGMLASIPVFLIPGIIFRAIIPTRNLGGMFIAIAIGFYFIMPTLFAVSFYLTHQGALQQLTQTWQRIAADSQGINGETNAISATSPLVIDLGQAESSLSDFWLSVLFYPALILAITYFSIVSIADFIGGFASYGTRTLMSRT